MIFSPKLQIHVFRAFNYALLLKQIGYIRASIKKLEKIFVDIYLSPIETRSFLLIKKAIQSRSIVIPMSKIYLQNRVRIHFFLSG